METKTLGQKNTPWNMCYGLQIFGLIRIILNWLIITMINMTEEQPRYTKCFKPKQQNNTNDKNTMNNRQSFEGMMPSYSHMGGSIKVLLTKHNYSSSALIYANYKSTRRFKPGD